MLDQTYNIKLADALRNRVLRADAPATLRFLGAEAGIAPGDIHHERFYELWFELDEARRITALAVRVTGDLISPCSGYALESLDQFDYPTVLEHCLRHTSP